MGHNLKEEIKTMLQSRHDDWQYLLQVNYQLPR